MCLEGNQLVSVSAMVSRFYLNKHQAKQQFDGVFVSKLMCQTVQVFPHIIFLWFRIPAI